MSTTTVQTLIDRAMTISDMHDNFVSPAEWIRWVNQENYALKLYLARCGWVLETHTTAATINTVGTAWTLVTEGTTTAHSNTLSGFYEFVPGLGAETLEPMAIVCVHEMKDNRLRALAFSDQVGFLRQVPGTSATTSNARSYRIVYDGTYKLSFNFYPEPAVGEVYYITFVRVPAAVTAVTDTLSYPMGWEERIVLRMARRALIKEESDTSEVDKLLQDMDSQIEELCWSKVLSSSPAVRNVDRETYGWTDRLNFPPWKDWLWV